MKIKIIKIFLFLILIAGLLSILHAQPLQVTATVDRTNPAVNQQLVFTVEFSGEAAQKVNQPELPDMGGYLSYLGSGGTSQSLSFTNGKMSVSKSFSFYYLATKVGSFTIPPVKVDYKGETYSSLPVEINIVPASQSPQTQAQQPAGTQDSDLVDGEDLFVRAIVNKNKVYQNEPIIITYKIYAAVSVSSYGITKLPETTGFWVEDFDIPQQPTTTEEVINGKRYASAVIKKVALFPTSLGEKTIGPIVLQCDVKVRRTSRSRDIFDSFFDDPFFGRTVRKSISSKELTVQVMPLPSADKPADFAGAVGQYKLDAHVDKNEVDTDEAVSLKVSISGTGNIRLLSMPNVQIPADFEQYDPNETTTINRSGNAISGTRSFEYVLVPRFPGEQKINPITFSYFDPQLKTYRRLVSPEIVINVARGKGLIVANGGSGLSKEEVKYIGRDIRFIKLSTKKFQPVGYKIYKSFIYLSLVIFPLFLLGITFIYKNHTEMLSENVAYARSRKANTLAKKRLSKSRSLLNEKSQKEFYAEVSNALAGFAADKLNLEKAGLVSDVLENEFKVRKIDTQRTEDFFKLLKECDFQRFAPASVSQKEMEECYQSAKKVIIKLEKEL